MADSDNESDFASAESDQEEPSTSQDPSTGQEPLPQQVPLPRQEAAEPPGVGQAAPQESAPDGSRKSSDAESKEQKREKDEAAVKAQPDESKSPRDAESPQSEPTSSEDDKEGREGGSSEAGTRPDDSDGTEVERRDSSREGSVPDEGKPSQEGTTAGSADATSQADSSAGGSKDEEKAQKSSGELLTESSKDKGVDPGSSTPEGKEKGPDGKGSSAEAARGGWGWGGWNSLWSSVSTVTESAQALGHKVTSVIASVEDTLGLPSPEDLADTTLQRQEAEEEEITRLAEEMLEHDVPSEDQLVLEEPHPQQPHPQHPPQSQPHSIPEGEEKLEQGPEQQSPTFSGFAGYFSGIASAIQSTGKELVTGGLDALETLGKKTMEVLSEGDPGLRRKRTLLAGGEAPNLSQLLKEAKAEAEMSIKMKEAEGATYSSQQPLSYSRLFDEYQGVVHLEALELLSKECETKVRSRLSGFSGDQLQALKEELDEISQAFTVEDQVQLEVLDDDSSKLSEVLELFSDVILPLKVEKLIKVSDSWRKKIQQSEASSTEDNKEDESVQPSCEVLYEDGLRSLAEMTSASIELFRKMAEVSLLPDAEKTDALEQTQRFNKLTMLVSSELDALASVHAEAITTLDVKGSNSAVTSLYLEASNSCSYVQDAFQLLCPVLQFKRIQESCVSEPSANVHARN